MTSNHTLALYFARRFAKMALVIFLVVFVLIAFIDYLVRWFESSGRPEGGC